METKNKILAVITPIVVFVLGALIIQSCEKEPPTPPPKYTVSINKIGNGIVEVDKTEGVTAGSNVNLKFTPAIGYSLYSVKVNGVKIEDIQPTTTEVSYTIQNINKNQYLEVVFEETDVLILSAKSTNEKPWMLTRVGLYKVEGGVFLANIDLTEAELTDRYYLLYPSMKTVVYQLNGGIRNGEWSLKQRVLRLGGTTTYEVLELTSNKFVFKAPPIWSDADKCNIYAVYTQERN